MKQCIVTPKGLHHRVLKGHTLYSHVVIASGTRLVFISGKVAKNEKGELVGKGDMRAQLRQVCENLKIALEAAGATFDDVVDTTTFTTDIQEYWRCVDVRFEYFKGPNLPASTVIGVPPGSIADSPDFLVEMKAVAVLD